MDIKKVTLKNWRSIGENPGIEMDLGRINVLSGVNDSGKTAILLGLYGATRTFYYIDDDPFLEEFLFIEGSKHEINTGEVIGKCDIEIITSINSPKLLKAIEQSIYERIIPNIERKDSSDKLIDIVTKYTGIIYKIKNMKGDPFDIQSELYFKDTITYIENDQFDFSEEDITVLLYYFNNFPPILLHEEFNFKMNSFYVSPSRQYSISTRRSESIYGVNNNIKLGYNASELIEFIKIIKTERLKRAGKYNQLIRYIQILFPEIQSISVNVPEGTNHEDIYVEWIINGQIKIQPLSRSGSGVISAIYLAGRLLSDVSSSTIAFIDEPEVSLHPKLQVRFLKLLRELSRDFGTQWIVTTHSPFIMKNLKEEDRLFLVEHDGVETKSRIIEPNNKSIVFQTLGAYLPDTISSKGLLIVEGATESLLLPSLLKKCGLDTESEGIVIIPIGGDNLYCIPPADLVKIHPNAMVIIDSDLSQSVLNGGSVLKKKLDYIKECKRSGVEIFMSSEYRTIENMYPKRCLAKILNISLEEMEYGSFDEIKHITNKNKLVIAKEISEEFTEEEARKFPIIESILNWWRL